MIAYKATGAERKFYAIGRKGMRGIKPRGCRVSVRLACFAGRLQPKQKPRRSGVLSVPNDCTYMRAIIASPKAEHFTSMAPSIRRAKS